MKPHKSDTCMTRDGGLLRQIVGWDSEPYFISPSWSNRTAKLRWGLLMCFGTLIVACLVAVGHELFVYVFL
jgi:hypothetical protein